jgi:hypothetical protein
MAIFANESFNSASNLLPARELWSDLEYTRVFIPHNDSETFKSGSNTATQGCNFSTLFDPLSMIPAPTRPTSASEALPTNED